MPSSTCALPRDKTGAFLTEVGLKHAKDGRRESVRPAERVAVPHPPSDSPGTCRRRLSVSPGKRRTSILNGVDGTTNAAGPCQPTKPGGGRGIRSLIQKAAKKTILVVRTKNAMQAAEGVTIRFTSAHPTDLPRSVQLPQIIDKVLDHALVLITKDKPMARSSFFTSCHHIHEFREAFLAATEINALLKDLFWFATARIFQPGQHSELEQHFFGRISDSFTALFVRIQMPPALQHQPQLQHQSIHARSRQKQTATRFLDVIPDVVAQVLFAALYEAFPKSRDALLRTESQLAVRQLCFSWLGGIENGGNREVATISSCTHWLPVGRESPKRIAALADFPAMRNRMLRAERIERTKLATRNRHAASVDIAAPKSSGLESLTRSDHVRYRHHHHHHHQPHQYGENDLSDPLGLHQGRERRESAGGSPTHSPSRSRKLTRATKNTRSNNDGGGSPAKYNISPGREGDEQTPKCEIRDETRERCVYEMQNSPLVTSFTGRHSISAAAGRLRVQLRITNSGISDTLPSVDDSPPRSATTPIPSKSTPMDQALVRLAVHAPRERRRRVADPSGFMLALSHIEMEGDVVRGSREAAKQATQERDAHDRRQLAAAQKGLDKELAALRPRSTKMHEFSNQIVSKKRIDTMIGASPGTCVTLASSGVVSSNSNTEGRSASTNASPSVRTPLMPRVSKGAR